MKIHRNHRHVRTVRPVHFQWNRVVTEEREGTSLRHKASVGRFMALGHTFNEAIANLFEKALLDNPVA